MLFFSSLVLSGTAGALPRGQLVVKSKPVGAKVLINGKFFGVTPFAVDLPPGKYRIRLVKKGYNSYRKTVKVRNFKRVKISPRMERIDLFGTVTVKSYPPNAHIYINDRFYNKTPEKIRLKKGTYTIRLEKDRFKPFVKKVKIRHNHNTVVSPELSPVQRFGTLKLTALPENCKVFIDDAYYDRSPLRTRLKPGTYTIRLTKRGYKPVVETIRIRRGKVNKKYFELERRRPRILKGWLKIYSFPENARVTIEGQVYGRTPIEARLPEGNYFVEITKKGFMPFEKNIYVSRADVSYINADLEKKEARRKFGMIHFTSSPRRSKVIIDGNYRGETPLSLKVPAGEHQIKIQRRGFEPYRKTMFVRPWDDHYVEAVLNASAPPPKSTGRLKIVSRPLDAKVFVNGAYKGKTPLKLSLNPNLYNVEIRHRGYLPYRQPVHIKPGKKERIDADMHWAGHLPPSPHEIIEELTKQIFE